jgi:hypothetical protein
MSMPVNRSARRRATALFALFSLVAPLLALPATSARAQFGNAAPAQRKGMSTKQKVVALAGAALLYYLYRKHQARQQQTNAATTTPGGTATNATNARPQLYRSKNGGVYYRDAQGKPVWLTAPSRRMEVPASEVQRYAPDYSRYQGRPLPPAPAGYRTQSFSEFDDSLIGSSAGSGMAAPGGPPGPGRR